ncbi:MAG: ATP-binding protein [Bacteroidales bacterium]|nr:ATP-binding protein [Bacteroidales bacterium]
MKVKYYFFILATLLIALMLLVFASGIQKEHRIIFYSVELLAFLIFIYLIFFYHKVINPFRSINNGMDLLREQDFGSHLIKVNQMEADNMVEIFNRMMSQLKDERLKLREQNNFLDLLIKATPMGVIILDFDEHITMLNDAALKYLDSTPEEIFGKGIPAIPDSFGENGVHGKKLGELSSPLAAETAGLKNDESKIIRSSSAMIYRCSKLSFQDRGASHPFFLIEKLTSDVMKAEKKAYEKVIRMISHEVNNTTAGITSTLESVIDALGNKGDLCGFMQVCVDRCYGMSKFITNFANVVKIPEPNFETVSLNKQVSDNKIFMENICGKREIKLHLNLCNTSPDVKMDTSLFGQVLTNIVKNSAESIGEKGDIYISTTREPATIEISDNGAGISKDAAEKLFSPFFSTKPNGQGIGLVFIREVLSKHNCSFSLRTYEDNITRFKIKFPEE